MKIVPVPLTLGLLPTAGRSAGLHISDIYNSLYARLEPARYGTGVPPNTLKMAIGLAWEAYLESWLHTTGVKAKRPPEQLTAEGIAFSPDLLVRDEQDHYRVGEIKVTWMSATDSLDDPKFDKWLTQVKAYGFHLGVPRARVYVLFVNGDYKTHRDPELRVYDIDFTELELQENWQMLMNHAQHEGMLGKNTDDNC